MDDGAEVSVETGLRAAEKLQSVLDGRERGTDILELKVQLGQISEAVRSVVPQSMWAAIVEKLEELGQHSEAVDVEADALDDADDPYDPWSSPTRTTSLTSVRCLPSPRDREPLPVLTGRSRSTGHI